ncbi:phage holin family protein [Erysipelothrix rhusiopathiae]|uniref:phage holin family protein n=1 Tax=Erysipelothrix rhusiopathiae TaxID=1648 RepID=UPI003D356176
MSELLNELLNLLRPTLITAGTIILSFLGMKMKKYYNVKICLEQQKQITNIVKAAVMFVEQVAGEHLLSDDKLSMAKHRAKVTLNQVGIDITDEELTMWIEAFVGGFNHKDALQINEGGRHDII